MSQSNSKMRLFGMMILGFIFVSSGHAGNSTMQNGDSERFLHGALAFQSPALLDYSRNVINHSLLDPVLGIDTIGTTGYPAGGMRRVSKLTLSSGNYSGLYGGVIDPVNGYAYFATANSINPGWIIKVDISGPIPVEVGAASAMTGESNLDAGAIDINAGVIFFTTTAGPAHIVKFSLGAGNAPPSYVGSLTLNSGENTALGIAIDTRDPLYTNHYLYVICTTSPGQIVKVAPGAAGMPPTWVNSITLNSGEDYPRRVGVDAVGGYMYVGARLYPKVIKVAMTTGNNPPQRIGAALLDSSTSYSIGSAVLDVADGAGYFGTYDVSLVPAQIYKVLLGSGSNPPTLAGSISLSPGPPAERELSTGIIDPAGGYAYFGTDHTYGAKIFKIRLGKSGTSPVETALLQLQSGTQPNPPDGTNVINNPETLYGEVFLQSSGFDPDHGYAYFGTDSNHGQVVKVAVSHKGAIKATRAVLTQQADIVDFNFYAHTARGNVRMALYDDQPTKALLWQSPNVPITVAGWQKIMLTPETLILSPGTYWLAWQVDSTADVPSYHSGSMGEGFLYEMPFGQFPSSLSAVQTTAETWSLYARYCIPMSGPANTLFVSKSGQNVNLQWGTVSGASGYNVKRCSGAIPCLLTTIASPVIPQYNDPVLLDSSNYWYSISAFSGCTP